jgi:anthranilate synthase component 2
MSKILLIDNYDSFTYNLVQYLEELTQGEVDVRRNNKITLEEVDQYDVIILSPGPGLPYEAGIMPEVLKTFAATKRILGVCLGHQAIIENFGGSIRNLEKVYHGVATPIIQSEHKSILFNDISHEFLAGRYHSWSGVVERMPAELQITALDKQGEIMAIQHKTLPIYGVQFHPESIMTAVGKKILANFLGIPYTITQEDYTLENASK